MARPTLADGGSDSGAKDASATADGRVDGATGVGGTPGAGGADARAGTGGSTGKSDSGRDATASGSATGHTEGGAGQSLPGSSAVSCGPLAGTLNPENLPSCTNICPLGSCVPANQLPGGQAEQFFACNQTDVCMPRFLIETLGNVRFKSCHSVGGFEGRCLPICLPIVAGQILPVPQDECLDTERCIPCSNPVTGADNGFCKYACDPGPQREPSVFAGCCGSEGVCLASDLLGAGDQSRLRKESCGANELCAPKDPSTTNFACEVRGSEPASGSGAGGATTGMGGKAGKSSDKDGGQTASAAAADDSGCGCRVGRSNNDYSAVAWLMALGTVSLVRRRRVIS